MTPKDLQELATAMNDLQLLLTWDLAAIRSENAGVIPTVELVLHCSHSNPIHLFFPVTDVKDVLTAKIAAAYALLGGAEIDLSSILSPYQQAIKLLEDQKDQR